MIIIKMAIARGGRRLTPFIRLRMYTGGVKIAKGGRNDTYTDLSVNGFLRDTVYQVYTTTTGIHIYMSRGYS